MTPRLAPGMLDRLPPAVARPGHDRAGMVSGIAHIGVGAFHRCHQAEYIDDLLALQPGPWGITGINLRPPSLTDTLGAQGGLYTRMALDGDRVAARVMGSILKVVDSQSGPAPALQVLADPAIRLVTLTVTEKGYCHRPATGALDHDHPEIRADLAAPEAPRSLPGVLVRALEMRRAAAAPPLTLASCDNIPANGRILRGVVTDLAARRDEALARWIEANVAFPHSMVDRIAPAVSDADRDRLATLYGYTDAAAVVCEPFRHWVIEDGFAGPMPDLASVGVQLVADVAPHELLKMRVLNGAQTTLAALGALCGLDHTFDDIEDPVLAAFVSRMLVEETLPTLPPVPGLDAQAYVGQSLDRLRNRAIRHRNHQIATDASQKIVQRLLAPMAERLRRGQPVGLLSVAVAGCMAYLIRGAWRFGAPWTPDDPIAADVAAIADRLGNDPPALVRAISGLAAIFPAELAQTPAFRTEVATALAGLLGSDPRGYLASRCGTAAALP